MKTHFLIILVIFALMLVACGAQPAPGIGNFPVGHYRDQSGKYDWLLETDGHFVFGKLISASATPAQIEAGNFAVAGDQISFKGDYCGDVTGTYTWVYNGASLIFKLIGDKCLDRVNVVIANPWVKAP